MYKTLTAQDYRAHLSLPEDYVVDGFIVYGTYKTHPFEQFEDSLRRAGLAYTKTELDHEFFSSLRAFVVEGQTYWVAIAYGGALLSEYLHLACLLGSKRNILIGSCGGLKQGAQSMQFVIPDRSIATESSASAYQPDANGSYEAHSGQSNQLAALLSEKHIVHRGTTVTFQAMMAETWDDVQRWAAQGFVGVEMEASTMFAVSRHFDVPAAAMLMIVDNLIEEQTVLDSNFDSARLQRRQAAQDAFDVAVRVLAGDNPDKNKH
jgi:purine-nucleoside phosphorylase